jgi:hypothetical protein
MVVSSAAVRAAVGRVLTALTPHPHRGDLIAAGAVPLTLGVLLVNVRLDGPWGTGVLLVVTALGCGLVLGMGLLAPLEGERPRSYQQVLLLAGMILGFTTLLRLAQVLGVGDPLSSSGATTWIFAFVTVGAVWIVRSYRSAVCALIAALAGIVTVLAFVDWVFSPESPRTARWLLLVLAGGLVLAALARRDRQRRESVYLIDAAGVAILVLALSFIGELFGLLTFIGAPPGGPNAGWKLVLLAAGLGLVAYAGVDREPGPAYLGTLILLLFVLFAGIPGQDGASLWFWPLALLLLGGVAVGAGLRPRRELPPEPPGPGGAGSDPPTEPLRGPGAGGLPSAPTRPASEADTAVRPRGGLWASPPPREGGES